MQLAPAAQRIAAGAAVMAAIAFVSSLQADLRDVAGDAATGVKTIPVIAGKAVGELVAYIGIATAAVAVAAMQLAMFYPVAVLAVPAAYHLGRGGYTKSQNFLLLAVILMPALMLTLNAAGRGL